MTTNRVNVEANSDCAVGTPVACLCLAYKHALFCPPSRRTNCRGLLLSCNLSDHFLDPDNSFLRRGVAPLLYTALCNTYEESSVV